MFQLTFGCDGIVEDERTFTTREESLAYVKDVSDLSDQELAELECSGAWSTPDGYGTVWIRLEEVPPAGVLGKGEACSG